MTAPKPIPVQDDLRLDFVYYELPATTIFNKKAVEYFMGKPVWYRRVYWWWQDVKKCWGVVWHNAFHQTCLMTKRNYYGRTTGVFCNACQQWIWREL